MFVRWDNLKVDAEEARTLPGYREPATVRTFDAPEALDTRFYEVRAKSALNKVPKASRMPFRWTINPYRGCSPFVPVLRTGYNPDPYGGRQEPSRSQTCAQATSYTGPCDAGDIGAIGSPKSWTTGPRIKAAYRITLEDSTELIASGDHRFLTEARVETRDRRRARQVRRPHLTLNDKLIGTGAFSEQPEHWLDYRRGYLCGMIRGDAHLASRRTERPDGRRTRFNRFRLALTDDEALHRTKLYLEESSGCERDESAFASLGRRSMTRDRRRWPLKTVAASLR